MYTHACTDMFKAGGRSGAKLVLPQAPIIDAMNMRSAWAKVFTGSCRGVKIGKQITSSALSCFLRMCTVSFFLVKLIDMNLLALRKSMPVFFCPHPHASKSSKLHAMNLTVSGCLAGLLSLQHALVTLLLLQLLASIQPEIIVFHQLLV